MSRIQALDEITARLGRPALLHWVAAPFGATGVVARFRHRGAEVRLSASHNFHLIFHLKTSEVERQEGSRPSSRQMPREGSIVISRTDAAERIQVMGAADTIHVMFSPELARASGVLPVNGVSAGGRSVLRSAAVRALVATAFGGDSKQMDGIVSSIATSLVDECRSGAAAGGGMTPQGRRGVQEMVARRLVSGVSVAELAAVAELSVHHFIKAHRRSEGLTPHALVIQQRLERAIHLLLTDQGTVEEVGMATGFASSSHFIRTFRRWMGVTPRAFQHATRTALPSPLFCAMERQGEVI